MVVEYWHYLINGVIFLGLKKAFDTVDQVILLEKGGIPQGSILGPQLFIVYINDFPDCNLFSKSRMYADDTSTLTLSAEDPLILEQRMNYDMNQIQS